MSYIPKDAVTQSFQSNKGVLTPNQIIELDNQNKFTKYGQLELIQTQEITSAQTYIDFTNIKEDEYNVHFITWNNVHPQTDSKTLTLRLSDDGGTSYESANYEVAFININASASFNATGSSSNTFMYCSTSVGTGTGECANGYAYLYHLGDGGKESFNTFQISDLQAAPTLQTFVGSQIYNQTSTINDLIFGTIDGSSTWTGDFSVYGLRFA